MRPELLVIMAKYPTPGKVKTRLARDVGSRTAARVYRALLMIHARQFAAAPFDVEWRTTPARTPFRRLVGTEYPVRTQPRGDLGDRLRTIFQESFARGYERVIAMASDAPDVGCQTVKKAFAAAKRVGMVVQPTEDGGYALIGMTTPADLFSGVAWSTSQVMDQTRERLRALGMEHVELPTTYDVDTVDDLRRAARTHPELR